MMQDQTEAQGEPQPGLMQLGLMQLGPIQPGRMQAEAGYPRWVNELRPLDLCCFTAAIGFIAYRVLWG